MTLFDDQEPGQQTRGEELLAQLKRDHVPPGQFRIVSLFALIILVSVVCAIPRMIGTSYKSFFMLIWFGAFATAPSATLFVATYFRRSPNRTKLAIATIFVTIVPTIAYMCWLGELDEILVAVSFTAVMFWIPQCICIWCIWFFLFRERRR